jgi:hypothetical protein
MSNVKGSHGSTARSGQARLWALLGVAAAVWTALVVVLFVWSGRFSLAAVDLACGAPAPDVRTAPSPADVQTFIASCGPDGLAAYRDLQLVDLLYPAVNAAFLVLVLALLLSALPRGLRWVLALPVVGAVGDYAENVAAWTLLAAGGDGSGWAGQLFQAGSAVKVAATCSSWTAALLLLVWVMVRVVAARLRDHGGAAPDPVAERGPEPLTRA